MLAKNATIFRITGPVSGLDEALKARPFMDLTPGMATGSGFVIASPDYGTFTRKAGDFTEFRLRTDTKIAALSGAEPKAEHPLEGTVMQRTKEMT